MKALTRFRLLLGVLLVSVVALAAVSSGPISIDGIQRWMKAGFYVGSTATSTTTNKVTRMLGNSATIDFTSTTAGRVFSSSITVTGALAGDPCFVGTPTAAAALKAKFGCLVDAADSVKVWFEPGDDSMAASCTLNAASPSVCTVTVSASSVCTCSPVGATAALAAAGCAVGLSSTTLTVTSLNGGSHVVNTYCKAPVDPASGTYYVRVVSAQP